ncbi:MAG: bile acid:sodium symporter family protein [Bacteroidota bacterium]
MDKASTIILASSLIIIMFGMGLSLTLADFKRIIQHPKAVVNGLINQLIFLPLVGFLLASVFDVRPEIAVGIMILAACPGGATSNLITHLAKGDTALSVTLTAVASLITVLTIPFIVQFSLEKFLGSEQEVVLDVPKTIGQLMVITVIPISIGMFLRVRAQKFAFRMEKPVKIASAVVFVLVVAGLLVKERTNIIPYFKEAGIMALILNVVTMTIGLLSSRLLSLPKRQAMSIAIESGIQNGTLAITIATVTLGNSELGIAGAIYGLVMFLTGGILIFVGNAKS